MQAQTMTRRRRCRIDMKRNPRSNRANFPSAESCSCGEFVSSGVIEEANAGREHIIGTSDTAHNSYTIKETTTVTAMPE